MNSKFHAVIYVFLQITTWKEFCFVVVRIVTYVITKVFSFKERHLAATNKFFES